MNMERRGRWRFEGSRVASRRPVRVSRVGRGRIPGARDRGDGGFVRLVVLGAAMVGVVTWQALPEPSGETAPIGSGVAGMGVRVAFELCNRGRGSTCVIDGDTIRVAGETIRIAGIDAPETHDFGCAEEKVLGDRATLRLQALLNGGAVTLSAGTRDEDVYGRKLRDVAVDGQDVGEVLVGEGLARWYGRGRREWC